MVNKPLAYPASGSALDEEILQLLQIPYEMLRGFGAGSSEEGSRIDALRHLAGHVSKQRFQFAGLLVPTAWALDGARVAASVSGMGSLLSCADLLATVEAIPGLYGYYSLADAFAEALAYVRSEGTAHEREAAKELGGVKVEVPREYAPGTIAGLVAVKAGTLDVASTPLGAGIAHKVGIDHHHLENPRWTVAPDGEGVGMYFDDALIVPWRHIRTFSIAACARVAFSTPVDKQLIHTALQVATA